jgi:hypothetical protein
VLADLMELHQALEKWRDAKERPALLDALAGGGYLSDSERLVEQFRARLANGDPRDVGLKPILNELMFRSGGDIAVERRARDVNVSTRA